MTPPVHVSGAGHNTGLLCVWEKDSELSINVAQECSQDNPQVVEEQ